MPIVAGGTGFYLRWFVHGKPRTPVSTAQTAKEVEDFLKQVPANLLFDSADVCPCDSHDSRDNHMISALRGHVHGLCIDGSREHAIIPCRLGRKKLAG